MPKYLTQEEAYMKCEIEGKFIFVEKSDKDKIDTTLDIAEADISSANILIKNISKDSKQWNSVYKLFYDALHELTALFLSFEKVKIDNHQCLFAYLCQKYQEQEFSWEFFEKVRTKRNGINYYGTPINYNDWKEVELQFNLYIKKLKKEIETKLKYFKDENEEYEASG